MMNLWIILLVMLLLAFCIVYLSLGFSKYKTPSRDALNKQLYKQRLSELSEDEKQGVLANQSDVVNELKLSLLDELPEATNKPPSYTSPTKRLLLLPGLLIVLLTGSMYFYLGSYSKIGRWNEVMARMPHLTDLMLVQQGEGASNQDLQDFILGVRTRLMQEPNDLRAWELMARIGLGVNDLQLALDSYQQALNIAPEDDDLKMSYANVLRQTGDPSNIQQAEKMVATVLKNKPNNIEGLSAQAFSAFQQEDFVKAIELWELILQQLSADSGRRGMIERSIIHAKKQLAHSLNAKQQTQEQSASPSYSVKLSLPNGLNIPSTATLFVFAKAVEGPPIPLAAKRMALPNFPAIISLSDADSMTQASKLSDSGLFYIGARIDIDGNVATKDGWQGKSEPILKGSTVLLEIEISEVVK